MAEIQPLIDQSVLIELTVQAYGATSVDPTARVDRQPR